MPPSYTAQCAEKPVERRYQFLFTKCNDAVATDCFATCFTALLGVEGGLTNSAVDTFLSGISHLGIQVVHLSPITNDPQYTTSVECVTRASNLATRCSVLSTVSPSIRSN